MTPPRNTVKLADLSAADRAALLKEAGATAPADESADLEAAARRTRAIGSLMDERDHERFCKEGPRRFELMEARRPPNAKKGIVAAYVAVVRCQDCGGSVVFEQTPDGESIVSDSGIEARDKLLAYVREHEQEADAA